MRSLMKRGVMALVACVCCISAGAQGVALWPAACPPDVKLEAGEPVVDKGRDGVTRIRKMPVPTLEKWAPRRVKSDVVMIVCPGGGYSVMAIDLEGTEVAAWLNKQGVTAYVLRYRVPNDRAGALQDAQRAIRMVRQENPGKRIGIMGFSAGADLSCRAATSWEKDTYVPVDEIDTLSCRPDFAALVYPAYLDGGENHALTPGLNVNGQMPPMFVFQTADDGYGFSALAIAAALKKAQVPVELHLYPKGGHGYGLREKKAEVAGLWPTLLKKWL